MRKLALRDEILLQIDKAARYIGGEVNAVMKNKDDVDIRFAMAFPDVYEIGMSNLGMMILYDMFNKRDDVWCERLFSPWTDLDKIMREEKIPLFTLESHSDMKCVTQTCSSFWISVEWHSVQQSVPKMILL